MMIAMDISHSPHPPVLPDRKNNKLSLTIHTLLNSDIALTGMHRNMEKCIYCHYIQCSFLQILFHNEYPHISSHQLMSVEISIFPL